MYIPYTIYNTYIDILYYMYKGIVQELNWCFIEIFKMYIKYIILVNNNIILKKKN